MNPSAARAFTLQVKAWWQELSLRERWGVIAALSALCLGLCWSVLIAPAWRTLQATTTQAPAIQAQWQHMQSLQAQALALKNQPSLGVEESSRLLRNLVVTLGPQSSISVQGDMATIQLKGVNPNALTQWLVQTREQAHALPVQAKLSRKSDAPNAAWDGQIVLQLPQKP